MIHVGTIWKISGTTASTSTAPFVMRTSRHRRRTMAFGMWLLLTLWL